MIKHIFLFSFLIITLALRSQDISEKNIRADIAFLSDDKLKGRGTSSPEELLAANYIADQFRIAGLSALNGSYLRPYKFRKGGPHGEAPAADAPELSSNNVVGFIDNAAPYTIVIGAHYDHLGLGMDHNSLDANPEGKIHNGADDNASGTAGVLELARYYSSNKKKEPCNLLFICFSGEELGLLGSKKWCENPDIPLEKINMMVNMDMIGRLRDSSNKVVVYGVGTSSVFVPLLDSLKSPFSVKKDSAGVGPSDQTSFYRKNIPILHFFTGQHKDYHKPSDDLDKINFAGEVEVLNYIRQVVDHCMNYPKLSFQATRTPDSGKVSFKVTMGVMPDYTFEGKGMRIDGVTDGKPASKAGILAGDIVTELGGQAVRDVQTYMKALSLFKKGDTTKVKVQRGEKVLEMDITF